VLVQIGLEFRQSPVASPVAHAIGKRNFPAELKSVDLCSRLFGDARTVRRAERVD